MQALQQRATQSVCMKGGKSAQVDSAERVHSTPAVDDPCRADSGCLRLKRVPGKKLLKSSASATALHFPNYGVG